MLRTKMMKAQINYQMSLSNAQTGRFSDCSIQSKIGKVQLSKSTVHVMKLLGKEKIENYIDLVNVKSLFLSVIDVPIMFSTFMNQL